MRKALADKVPFPDEVGLVIMISQDVEADDTDTTSCGRTVGSTPIVAKRHSDDVGRSSVVISMIFFSFRLIVLQ